MAQKGPPPDLPVQSLSQRVAVVRWFADSVIFQKVSSFTPKQRRKLLLQLQQAEEVTSPGKEMEEDDSSRKVVGHHAVKTFLSRHAVSFASISSAFVVGILFTLVCFLFLL